jgi:hemerythrin-like domain-containing protein
MPTPMDATDLLKEQHREVAELFKSALKFEGKREQHALAQEIVDRLMIHAAIEEEIFYPAFREADETERGKKLVLESYEEHGVMKYLLDELTQAGANDERFEAKLTVLQEIVERHVEEEEMEMFPAARKKLDERRLSELAGRMASRVAELGGATEFDA